MVRVGEFDLNTVNSVIEDCLLFNFWTFGAVLYLSFYLIKVQIITTFPVFYSRQSSITEFTILVGLNILYVIIVSVQEPFQKILFASRDPVHTYNPTYCYQAKTF